MLILGVTEKGGGKGAFNRLNSLQPAPAALPFIQLRCPCCIFTIIMTLGMHFRRKPAFLDWEGTRTISTETSVALPFIQLRCPRCIHTLFMALGVHFRRKRAFLDWERTRRMSTETTECSFRPNQCFTFLNY